MNNLILCGFPKSGKTSVGTALAKELNKPFIDTDRYVEQLFFQEKGITQSARQIILGCSEEYFRDLEQKVVHTLLHISDSVIALGGGTLLSVTNRTVLRSIGEIFYLHVPEDVLWGRFLQNGFPIAFRNAKNRSDFFRQRQKIYQESAHYQIDLLDETLDDIVLKIVQRRKETVRFTI